MCFCRGNIGISNTKEFEFMISKLLFGEPMNLAWTVPCIKTTDHGNEKITEPRFEK